MKIDWNFGGWYGDLRCLARFFPAWGFEMSPEDRLDSRSRTSGDQNTVSGNAQEVRCLDSVGKASEQAATLWDVHEKESWQQEMRNSDVEGKGDAGESSELYRECELLCIMCDIVRE